MENGVLTCNLGFKGKEKVTRREIWNKSRSYKDSSRLGNPSQSTQTKTEEPKTKGCFICTGPHLAKNCPVKVKLNALELQDDLDCFDAEPCRANPIQFLNAIQTEGKSKQGNGLFYVRVSVNGLEVHALVDTGATDNFISDKMARKQGLYVERDNRKSKSINAEAADVGGLARKVAVCVGEWKGHCNFTVMPIDDFQIILGLNFFIKTKAVIFPHLQGMFIMETPCFVHFSRSIGESGSHSVGDVERKKRKKAGLVIGEVDKDAKKIKLAVGHGAKSLPKQSD